MSIWPNWIEVSTGTDGATLVDSLFVNIVEDDIVVTMESSIIVEIVEDIIIVEIC
ncbi:MAG: hypothetical protein PF440_05045 [Thiomicrorhabdus sp.]|jgi:hypothetical protein|nr:hypothetical protein [Thiomicrorhabdus sp.]